MHTFLVTIPYRAQYRIVAATPNEALTQALQKTAGADILERGEAEACTVRLVGEQPDPLRTDGGDDREGRPPEPHRPTTLKTALEDRDAEEQWADLVRLERDLYGAEGPSAQTDAPPPPPGPRDPFHEHVLNALNQLHTDLSDIAGTLKALVEYFAWDDEVLKDDRLTEASP